MLFAIANGIVTITILVITVRHIDIVQYGAENTDAYLFEP